MVRVISQIGDSTDGEDYDELPGVVNTLRPKKQDLVKKMNEYKYKHKYKDASTRAEQELDLNISCILKEIGNQLLQSEEVRTEYKNIKSAFIPQRIKNQIDTLDNQLGRGWGLIVNYYDLIKNKMLEGAASDYFEINEEKIKKACGTERDYQNLNNNAERGEYYLKKKALETDLVAQLKTDVELIFGIEVKRNPAALLTNAMFFDLVDAGQYEIEDIATKMPMAMKNAVSASVIIDKVMGKLTYDYRDNLRGSEEVLELVKKDESILQDWLNLKLNISSKIERSDTTNAIPNLGMNDLVKKLADLKLGHIDTSKCNTRKKIQNEENIGFNFDDCSGIVKLQWNTAVGKFKVSEPQIHHVKAKVFYDLILEWYGIKLPYLNKSDKIILKAAAEPKDLEDNQDEGNSKVLAIDEGKLAPETELSEYKQEDYILDKDNFDTVLQHEHAFVQPLGEIVAIS